MDLITILTKSVIVATPCLPSQSGGIPFLLFVDEFVRTLHLIRTVNGTDSRYDGKFVCWKFVKNIS